MKIKLSDHFTYGKLLRFTAPSVTMMIFTSVYCLVDGFFVSNFAGKVAFTAINFILPYLLMLSAVGYMFGAGGAALVAKTFGEGDTARAKEYFSLIVYSTIASGVIIEIIGMLLLRPTMSALGAEGELLEACVIYGRIILLALPAFVVQASSQNLFVTAEKPGLGLLATIVSGVANIVFDAIFVAICGFGLVGAAVATAISQLVGGVIPIVYFSTKNSSLLSLGKTKFYPKALIKTVTNGSSELMNNISASLVGMLYNVQLLKYSGEDGVAAYGVMLYVNYLFVSTFIGYVFGVAPIIGYHYGASGKSELKNLLKKSTVLIAISSIGMFLISYFFATPLSKIFVGYDEGLLALAVHGLKIFSTSFLVTGFAIFASGFFTALNDGLTSAILAFLRTLVFQLGAILILPLIFELDGIWVSVTVSEFLAVIVGVVLVLRNKNKYGYL